MGGLTIEYYCPVSLFQSLFRVQSVYNELLKMTQYCPPVLKLNHLGRVKDKERKNEKTQIFHSLVHVHAVEHVVHQRRRTGRLVAYQVFWRFDRTGVCL